MHLLSKRVRQKGFIKRITQILYRLPDDMFCLKTGFFLDFL